METIRHLGRSSTLIVLTNFLVTDSPQSTVDIARPAYVFQYFWFSDSKFSIGHFQREYMPLLDKPHYLRGVWLPDPSRLLYLLFHTSGSSNSLKKRKKSIFVDTVWCTHRVLARKLRVIFQKHDASGVAWFQRYHMFEDACPPRILNSLPARSSGSPERVPFSAFLFSIAFSPALPLIP